MQHLDEGTIHTWLDGQLPGEEAAAVEAHVAECRQCADAVAEARGLIAASSRILMALDNVPVGVVPSARQPSAISHQPSASGTSASKEQSAAKRAQRRWFRGPSLAAAATIVVAVGTFALMRAGGGDRSGIVGAEVDAPARLSGPAVADSAISFSAPSPVPTPSVAPSVANEARDEVATQRRGFADGARPAESNEAARRLREAPAAGSQIELAKQEAQKSAVQATVATSQRSDVAPAPVVVSPPAAPKPDTARVQVFRGTRQEVKDFSADERQKAAKAVVDAAAVATGSIRGRVTDANRTGIEGAVVTVENTAIGVTSSRTGEFELGGVPAGAQRLNARRVGYAPVTQSVTVTGSQVATADITLAPARTALAEVTTALPTPSASAPVGAVARAQGAPVTPYGCYEVGITPGSSQARSDFREIPRRIALDSVVVPARTDGIWYQVRDLSRGGVVNGVWRPYPPDGIEAQWIYGTKTATLRLTGLSGQVLRGSAEEIDRQVASGTAAAAVAAKTRCDAR